MGLNLPSPIIAASSGLTNDLKNLVELEAMGAGAVVLKSLFEEEIIVELDRRLNKMNSENFLYPETYDYYEEQDVEDTLTEYLRLIYEAKKSLQIPVIASINSVTANNWPYFSKYLQDAGADAIELNISIFPADDEALSDQNEKTTLAIINAVLKEVTIPVSIKISPYFSNLARSIKEFSQSGIKGIAMFNRFYSPDYDINSLEITPAPIYSNPSEYILPLRWIAIASGKADCDLVGTTGIHDGATVARMILAGAKGVEVASSLYKNGINHIQVMNSELNRWMDSKGYKSIEDFRGLLNYAKTEKPAGLIRTQFMKHFAGK
jgi:dihydroorotate dehydrogenase (fumarate)